ncbi:Reticulan like protein B13, putative [Theobroma cacao]|uniref:Reticulon-like protein n=2 Tax=Theobroma cacao TaxID=3641 RepID=A0A061DGR9_THECC|nr:Reticulan like protein B13, putative [Theobroma cacao]
MSLSREMLANGLEHLTRGWEPRGFATDAPLNHHNAKWCSRIGVGEDLNVNKARFARNFVVIPWIPPCPTFVYDLCLYIHFLSEKKSPKIEYSFNGSVTVLKETCSQLEAGVSSEQKPAALLASIRSMSATPRSALDAFRDIILWRRKKLSATVLLVSTATWVLLEVYQLNFITVASWLAMFIVASLFLWGNVLRLLGKEPPNLSDLELSKETALEIENTCRTFIEEVIGWMFHVTVEGDWLVFARTVVGLLLLSYVGSDLLTLLYIGIKTAMTVPLIYVKYGDQIKRCGERVKDQFRRLYEMFDEKVIRKMKSKIVREENKEKKVE